MGVIGLMEVIRPITLIGPISDIGLENGRPAGSASIIHWNSRGAAIAKTDAV